MPPWHANPAHGEFSTTPACPNGQGAVPPVGRRRHARGRPADLPRAAASSPTAGRSRSRTSSSKCPSRSTCRPRAWSSTSTSTSIPKLQRGHVDYAAPRRGRATARSCITCSCSTCRRGRDGTRREDALFNAIAAFAPGMPAMALARGVCSAYAGRLEAGLPSALHAQRQRADRPDGVGHRVCRSAKVGTRKCKFGVGAELRVPHPARRCPTTMCPPATTFNAGLRSLHALTPHMHYRGKSFRFTAEYPDGNEEILLDVPRVRLQLAERLLARRSEAHSRGHGAHMRRHYDNSADNPPNPDPTKEVHWGDQTWEEMMLGSFVYSLPETAVRGRVSQSSASARRLVRRELPLPLANRADRTWRLCTWQAHSTIGKKPATA